MQYKSTRDQSVTLEVVVAIAAVRVRRQWKLVLVLDVELDCEAEVGAALRDLLASTSFLERRRLVEQFVALGQERRVRIELNTGNCIETHKSDLAVNSVFRLEGHLKGLRRLLRRIFEMLINCSA